MRYYKTQYMSPMGPLTILCTDDYLVQLDFSGTETPEPDLPLSSTQQDVIDWLDAYFSGQNPSPTALPLNPPGTQFQQQVWEYLLEVPSGQTVTYGEIAAKIAAARGMRRMSAQAVGQAVGANPIPIIIPCHRVVGAGGKLTGYSCGLSYKIQLLEHEHIPYKK